MSEEQIKEIKEELAKISFSNIGHCVNTNLILDYITNLQEEIERLKEKTNKLEEEPLTHTMGRIDSVVSNIYRNNKEKDKEIERLNKRIEDLNIINEEHQILNGMIRKELQQKENIIKEVREKLNTQLAFTSSYQLNYQSAMGIIEEAKSILDKENK